jgi:hypothetical protein
MKKKFKTPLKQRLASKRWYEKNIKNIKNKNKKEKNWANRGHNKKTQNKKISAAMKQFWEKKKAEKAVNLKEYKNKTINLLSAVKQAPKNSVLVYDEASDKITRKEVKAAELQEMIDYSAKLGRYKEKLDRIIEILMDMEDI